MFPLLLSMSHDFTFTQNHPILIKTVVWKLFDKIFSFNRWVVKSLRMKKIIFYIEKYYDNVSSLYIYIYELTWKLWASIKLVALVFEPFLVFESRSLRYQSMLFVVRFCFQFKLSILKNCILRQIDDFFYHK